MGDPVGFEEQLADKVPVYSRLMKGSDFVVERLREPNH